MKVQRNLFHSHDKNPPHLPILATVVLAYDRVLCFPWGSYGSGSII